jgi:hypothetical protein
MGCGVSTPRERSRDKVRPPNACIRLGVGELIRLTLENFSLVITDAYVQGYKGVTVRSAEVAWTCAMARVTYFNVSFLLENYLLSCSKRLVSESRLYSLVWKVVCTDSHRQHGSSVSYFQQGQHYRVGWLVSTSFPTRGFFPGKDQHLRRGVKTLDI